MHLEADLRWRAGQLKYGRLALAKGVHIGVRWSAGQATTPIDDGYINMKALEHLTTIHLINASHKKRSVQSSVQEQEKERRIPHALVLV